MAKDAPAERMTTSSTFPHLGFKFAQSAAAMVVSLAAQFRWFGSRMNSPVRRDCTRLFCINSDASFPFTHSPKSWTSQLFIIILVQRDHAPSQALGTCATHLLGFSFVAISLGLFPHATKSFFERWDMRNGEQLSSPNGS